MDPREGGIDAGPYPRTFALLRPKPSGLVARRPQAIDHLPQQAVGPGEFEDGTAGRAGAQEIAHRASVVVEAFPVHFPRDGEGMAQGVVGDMPLHPGVKASTKAAF